MGTIFGLHFDAQMLPRPGWQHSGVELCSQGNLNARLCTFV